MNERILLVDDEKSLLDAMQRQLRKQFSTEIAVSGWDALEILSTKGPFSVVISDMRMPGMDGVQFLTAVKTRSPETVRVMLTGNADLQTAVDAVNEGHIFRFLTKPCPPDLLSRTITAAVMQYQLITAEKELLEKTLGACVRILTEILSLVNPAAFGRSQRLTRMVRHMAQGLKMEHVWQLDLGAMLSQVGAIVMPADTINRIFAGMAVTPAERQMFDTHPSVARNLLDGIPRMGTVARIIEEQRSAGAPETPQDGWINSDLATLGGHLLKIALSYDQEIMQGASPATAMQHLTEKSAEYNPELLRLLADYKSASGERISRMVHIKDLDASMVLDDDIRSKNGMLLVTKGHPITVPLMQRLRVAEKSLGVEEPFRVLVEVAG